MSCFIYKKSFNVVDGLRGRNVPLTMARRHEHEFEYTTNIIHFYSKFTIFIQQYFGRFKCRVMDPLTSFYPVNLRTEAVGFHPIKIKYCPFDKLLMACFSFYCWFVSSFVFMSRNACDTLVETDMNANRQDVLCGCVYDLRLAQGIGHRQWRRKPMVNVNDFKFQLQQSINYPLHLQADKWTISCGWEILCIEKLFLHLDGGRDAVCVFVTSIVLYYVISRRNVSTWTTRSIVVVSIGRNVPKLLPNSR